jgi:hypothetical protein
MVEYLAHFESTLAALKDERRYRVFADLEREAGRFPHAHGRYALLNPTARARRVGIAAITARHT